MTRATQTRKRRECTTRQRAVHSLLFLVCSWCLATSAQAKDSRLHFTFSVEQHVGVFQEDVFAAMHIQIYQRLRVPQLGRSLMSQDAQSQDTSFQLMLQAPLRVRVSDLPPYGDPIGIRKQDWDSPRDGFRVLRKLAYGEPGSPLSVHIGELNAVSLGHGSLIANSFNAVNPDAPAAGVLLNSSTRSQDTALMVDDVLVPSVVAVSALARPFAIMDREPLMQRLGVGIQVAADLRAPTSLTRDDEGFVEVDATSAPTVLTQQATFVGGPAAEFWVLARPRASVLMHAEVFWHDRLGRGEHLGLSGQWTPNQLFAAQLKSSVIFAHDRYVPRYISPLYQVERFQIAGLGAELPSTKLGLVSGLAPRDDLYLSNTLTLDLPLWRSALMLDYLWARDTPDADALTVSVRTQPIDKVSLNVFYHQNFFEDLAHGIDLQRSLVGSELRVMPWGPMYVVGRYDRRWRLRDDGRWQGVQDWHIGLGFQLGLEVN